MDKQERKKLRKDIKHTSLEAVITPLLDHIDALEGQKILLLDALNAAMGWNWLDEDVPPNIVEKCGAALTQAEEK